MACDAGESAALEAARAGDPGAFGLLVERHQEAVFRAAWLILRDTHAAEDIAQETFVRAHRHLPRFDAGHPLRPWLLRVATNLALNEARRRRRAGGLFARLTRIDRGHDSGPEASTLAADEQSRVQAAIAHLRGDDQVVLYLRYYLDLPIEEIAATIERPVGTAKSRLSRARARLRAVIEAHDPGLIPLDLAEGAGHD